MNKTIVISIQIFVALILASCAKENAQQEAGIQAKENPDVVELSAEQASIGGIQIGQVEDRHISGAVNANGHLDVPPQQMVSISAPLGGFLKGTTLLQGSKVNRGQVIGVIENPDYIQLQQEYLEAKNH